MNKGGFSWKRAVGVTGAKRRVSRATGIPLTKSGRQRKAGKAVTGGGCLLPALLLASALAAGCAGGGTSLMPSVGAAAATPTATGIASVPTPLASGIPAPTVWPTLTPTAAPTPWSITIKGKGMSNSKRFRLDGDYQVDWTAKASSSSGCYHGADLERADGTLSLETLANELISDAKQHSGTTNLYNLDAADYYISASSGCSWSFTFTLQ